MTLLGKAEDCYGKVKPTTCPECGSEKQPVRIRARNPDDWKGMCPDCGYKQPWSARKVKPKRESGVKLRPAVKRFAEAMERILRENDHKEGWEELSNDHLVERMEDELNELHVELFHIADYREPNLPDIAQAVHEAIDLANFAMMFFDNNRDHYEKEADE